MPEVSKKMDHDFVEDLKRAVSDGLPTSSYIVGEVIKTIYDESSSALDLASIIERDPPLTAKILKVSNSAYYGATKKITSLQRAVVVLGFATIKELVTTMAIVHSFFETSTNTGVDRPGLWLHSIGVAKASQLVAQKTGTVRPDISYTVGLLHDIGKIVLAMSFPDIYKAVVEYVKENNIRIIEAEQRILNIDHCMIGRILCSIWDLPDELGTAILFHHNPSENSGETAKLSKIVHIGDIMARNASIGNPGDLFKAEPFAGAQDVLGSTREEQLQMYSKLNAAFLKEKQEIEDFFAGIK